MNLNCHCPFDNQNRANGWQLLQHLPFRRPFSNGCLIVLLTALPQIVFAQDKIEFLDGRTVTGKVIEIRADEKEFDFRSESDDGASKGFVTHPYAEVHAVTLGGKRYVFNPLPPSQQRQDGARSREDVLQLIAKVGPTPPQWYDSTPLQYPNSLDLSWPKKPGGAWNNRKNVGQYIWDIVNPNESKWHAGIKLVHHCMTLHRDDQELLQRDMNSLGGMYFNLLQDYPRAAFWFQKSGATVSTVSGIHLAECYWRLGNRQMALDLLSGKRLNINAVKLFGDLGAIDDAKRLAEAYSRTPQSDAACLAVGDALRNAERFDEAVEYYQMVLDTKLARNPDYEKRFDARARGAIEAIRLFDQADVLQVADGTYRDKSTGYNGDVEVEVVVNGAKIKSLRVTKHNEKQYYAALRDTPAQVLQKQSVQGVDGTSGATITSQAIVHATARALASGSQ